MMYDLLKEWESIDSELRELRRSKADWNYIKSLPQKIREAIEIYIETGDLWISAKIAGMTEDEFNKIRIRAGILW
jgi:hypothetical protein